MQILAARDDLPDEVEVVVSPERDEDIAVRRRRHSGRRHGQGGRHGDEVEVSQIRPIEVGDLRFGIPQLEEDVVVGELADEVEERFPVWIEPSCGQEQRLAGEVETARPARTRQKVQVRSGSDAVLLVVVV